VANLKQISLSARLNATDHDGQYPSARNANNFATAGATPGVQVWRFYITLSNELATPAVVSCPSDLNDIAPTFGRPGPTGWTFADSNISYSASHSADENWPMRLVASDRNMRKFSVAGQFGNGVLRPMGINDFDLGWGTQQHISQGNISLTDGSVQQNVHGQSADSLWHFMRNCGTTNLVAFPK
jgi:hypothetical protein